MQSKRDGNCITYHKYPEALLSRYSPKYQEALQTGHLDVIDRIKDISSYEVVEIDYSMSEDEMTKLLSHSKMHFTYRGASYFLAACINIPTVCYGNPTRMSHPSKWWEYGEYHEESVQVTVWGDYDHCARIPTTRIGQYDFERQSVIQRPQRYVYHTNSVKELEGILKGFPIVFNDIEYSVDD